MAKAVGVLIKARGSERAFVRATTAALGAADVSVEPILQVPAQPGRQGLTAGKPTTWYRIGQSDAQNPWDAIHTLFDRGMRMAAGGRQVEAAEPDFSQNWFARDEGAAAADAAAFCVFDDQDTRGQQAQGGEVAWNAGRDFSQLKQARDRVGEKLGNIVIAHLDTGYDPNHVTCPENLAPRNLHRNFFDDGHSGNDAADHVPADHSLMRNRGHGTGTLSLLAGNKLDGTSPGWPGFDDYIGAAPKAKIIPVSIADWVVRFTTGTMVQGFDHALKSKRACPVDEHGRAFLGGAHRTPSILPTTPVWSWSPRPATTLPGTPSTIVFPARFRRVLAACGVMADGRAYTGLTLGTMQGNYGPASKMDTALGAYTPNVPWAQIDCRNVVDMDGAGTSAATPQIAAAAALWLAEHWERLSRYSEPWMRVEAVRHALFTAAGKTTPRMNRDETHEKIGQGVLRAFGALAVRPLAEAELRTGSFRPPRPPGRGSTCFSAGGVSFGPETHRRRRGR